MTTYDTFKDIKIEKLWSKDGFLKQLYHTI